MSDAMKRLEGSRARLRLAMAPPVVPDVPRLTDSPSDSVFHRVLEFPAVESVIESVSAWWSHHPLRPVAQVANEASAAVVRPLAQRNPFVLVLAAAAVGAVLTWSRPWRWIFRSALFAGLAPQLATRIVSRLPLESWMSMLSAALSRPTATAGRQATRTTRL